MKKTIFIILFATIFNFTFACSNCVNNFEHNKKIKKDLFNDIISITKKIVSNNIDLKEKKIYYKKLKAKKKLFYFSLLQTEEHSIKISRTNILEIHPILTTNLKCNSCSGQGCDLCNWDGYFYTPSTSFVNCGACNGTGTYNNKICKGCKGSGWANSIEDPRKYNIYIQSKKCSCENGCEACGFDGYIFTTINPKKCSLCKGNGKYKDKICSSCNGAGYKDYTPDPDKNKYFDYSIEY